MPARYDHRGNTLSPELPGEKLMERLGEAVGSLSQQKGTVGKVFREISGFLEGLDGKKN